MSDAVLVREVSRRTQGFGLVLLYPYSMIPTSKLRIQYGGARFMFSKLLSNPKTCCTTGLKFHNNHVSSAASQSQGGVTGMALLFTSVIWIANAH